MITNKKSSILLILKVLSEYSDENHYLTHQQIIDKVKANYGIELERKSIAFSIQLLQELDYDIEKGPKGGYRLLSRLFDPSEVKFLVDAIFSSKAISGKQAKTLAESVSSCLSKYDRRSYDYLIKSEDVNRTQNKQVFYNIEIINEAIKRGKWVGFKYLDYDKEGKPTTRFDGYEFHASPCYLINNFGHYYLLAYRPKYDSVASWRVDYMSDVKIMEERDMKDPATMREFKPYASITEYMNDHIYMFGGDVQDCVMKLKSPWHVSFIVDWFGSRSTIYKEGDELFARVRCDEDAFFYWAMQYGEHITIVSPENMIKRIKKAATSMLEKYSDKVD